MALAAVLALPGVAQAAPAPFGLSCEPKAEVRFCQGNGAGERVASFDGVPLDADVTLPASGEGPWPTIVMLHGWGGSKTSFEADAPEGNSASSYQTYHYNNIWFAQRGYAVLTYSARGWGRSCGTPDSRTLPACNNGWIHLKDRRTELRDTQFLLGTLVDQGIAAQDALGATGISYGGGESMQLAYLRDKVQMPDGSYVPWTSPGKGIPLAIRAAWPRWPWSDLVYSLLPNGRFLDFDNSTNDQSRTPIGIPIQTYIEGLFALGAAAGWYAPPGVDPAADLSLWHTRVLAGEPTDDPLTQRIANEVYNFHQAFGSGGGGAVAPLLIQNGWTDDLFPPHEALRVYNSLRAADPDADVALQFGDLGHARGSNKRNADIYMNEQGTAFLDKHLRGASGAPAPGSVTAFTQTCPSERGVDAGGPFTAPSWDQLHPGVVRFGSAEQEQVTSTGGNPATGRTLDPLTGGGACATVEDEDAPGTAVVEGEPSAGYTLMGRPTVRATVVPSGPYAQLDSRLWDLAPNGERVLVSRGAYRLEASQANTRITFQLNGNGYRFAKGHVPQLELLGQDAPYLRPSNFPFTVAVSDVAVELPVLERPGSVPGVGGPAGAGSRKPRLRVRVRPRRIAAGRRTELTFTVTSRRTGEPVRRARVRFAGNRARTGRRGRARLVVRIARRGVRRARLTRRGYRAARVRVRVVGPPRFAG